MSDGAILGNERVRTRLGELSAASRLHSCLLFEGPQGVGKAMTARWLAMHANCTGDTGGGIFGGGAAPYPCGDCWSCRHIAKGEHMDVIEVGLDPERTAPIISARQARALIEQLSVQPYNARRRFVIIDPADAMNASSANALLKTLEEPPTDTGFILITHRPASLLPTVRSRTQRVRFGAVAAEELIPWLAAQGVPDAARVALLSDGCPGRALKLGVEGSMASWLESRDAVLRALGGGMGGMLALSESLGKGERGAVRQRVERAFDATERLLGDALRVQATGGTVGGDQLFNADRREVIDAWAQSLDLDGIQRLSAAIRRARGDIEAHVNTRLVLDTLLTRMATELGQARLVGA
jgi:DNA polymerase-3 subunit delta'